MKKAVFILLCILISCTLLGCGKSSNTGTVNPDAAQQVEDASATSSEPAADSENAEAVSKNDDGGLLTSLFSKEIFPITSLVLFIIIWNPLMVLGFILLRVMILIPVLAKRISIFLF